MNKWDKRFMEMARLVSTWGRCFQACREVGAVIVKDKRVVTTGYNGAPQGIRTCKERGECLRRRLNIPSGTRTEICYAIHAEQNAVIQAAKLGVSIDGGTCYCTHQPCSVCARILDNAGSQRIEYEQGYPDAFSLEILNEADIELVRYADLEAEGTP